VSAQVEASTDSQALARLVADLKAFEGREEVVKALRTELREPVPRAREEIRRAAVDLLPAGNGLGAWVARISVTLQTRLASARSAGITLRGGRNSAHQRSDVDAIDRGRVRAPSWGHRGPGAWHNQTVPAGFFTDTIAGMAEEWRQAAIVAVDQATEVIRNGG
jgi:hypothetical protein